MDNETLKMFSRLKQTSEGIDFIAFLESQSLKNYEEWKRTSLNESDLLKGKALVYDELIKVLRECDDKLNVRTTEIVDSFI